MGKKQKIRQGAGDLVAVPGPLDRQIEKSNLVRQKLKMEQQVGGVDLFEDELLSENEEKMEGKLNAKMVKMARKQWSEDDQKQKAQSQARGKAKKSGKITLKSSSTNSSDDEEEEGDQTDQMFQGMQDLEQELMQISAQDELAVQRFFCPGQKEELQDRINTKKVAFKEQILGQNADATEDLNPEVVKLYKSVGEVMAKYRSGKVPKAFKMIPSMVNWEDLLFLTCPEDWSAGAMLQATRLFSSCMSPAMCQRFYNLILLPRVRDEVSEYKKLSHHIYECLFKAIYKPAAFFKGILLPLCDINQPRLCTLREAWVVGSVLRKISIPVLHAAAAMLKICEMDYYGPNSYILRILIDKRYTLPFRAIDGLVFHFLKMRGVQPSADGEPLPVLWHQALLSFVTHYKRDVSSEQREALLELIKVHSHRQMTPEIRRHLQLAESRNEESEANVPDYARDDAMDY